MQKTSSTNKYLSILFILFVFFSFVSMVKAEISTIPTQIPDLEEQVDISIDPKYPKPGDPVSIKLEAYGIDLNNSEITWTNGSKVLLQGKGEKTLQTTVGKEGQNMTITARIVPPNSKELERTITINPQNVDILWESKTYTPPFYRGKALFSPQETLKLVAIPNQIDGAKAIYKWTEDDEVHADRSGFGVNTYKFVGDIISKRSDFAVNVSDGNGISAENTIAMAPTNPEVYIYENSPLYGVMFNRELSSLFDMGTNQEGTLSVYPYFFGVTSRSDKSIEYKWTINDVPINVPTVQSDLTFRNTENVDGKSKIGLIVTNINNFLQEVQKGTLINFKKNSGDSFSF